MLILIGIVGVICFDVPSPNRAARIILYRFGGTTFPDAKRANQRIIRKQRGYEKWAQQAPQTLNVDEQQWPRKAQTRRWKRLAIHYTLGCNVSMDRLTDTFAAISHPWRNLASESCPRRNPPVSRRE
jgi:hypothetical protein